MGWLIGHSPALPTQQSQWPQLHEQAKACQPHIEEPVALDSDAAGTHLESKEDTVQPMARTVDLLPTMQYFSNCGPQEALPQMKSSSLGFVDEDENDGAEVEPAGPVDRAELSSKTACEEL